MADATEFYTLAGATRLWAGTTVEWKGGVGNWEDLAMWVGTLPSRTTGVLAEDGLHIGVYNYLNLASLSHSRGLVCDFLRKIIIPRVQVGHTSPIKFARMVEVLGVNKCAAVVALAIAT